MPFDANPVVQRLQREVRIGGRLQFDDGQAAGAVYREQVEDAAVAGRERGHLAVDRVGQDGRVKSLDLRARLRLEPRFGTVPEQGMVAIRPGPVQLGDEAPDFRRMVRPRDGPVRESETQLATGELGELEAANPETEAAVVFRD